MKVLVIAERFLALALVQPGGEVSLPWLFTQGSVQGGKEGAEKILQLSVLNILMHWHFTSAAFTRVN